MKHALVAFIMFLCVIVVLVVHQRDALEEQVEDLQSAAAVHQAEREKHQRCERQVTSLRAAYDTMVENHRQDRARLHADLNTCMLTAVECATRNETD